MEILGWLMCGVGLALEVVAVVAYGRCESLFELVEQTIESQRSGADETQTGLLVDDYDSPLGFERWRMLYHFMETEQPGSELYGLAHRTIRYQSLSYKAGVFGLLLLGSGSWIISM